MIRTLPNQIVLQRAKGDLVRVNGTGGSETLSLKERLTDKLGGQKMKLEILAIAALLSTMGFAVPVKAENPNHLKRLALTKECPGCDLSGANLKSHHLLGADLRNANLKGANLSGANLEGADLTGANLSEANLTRTFASGATFKNANLTKANLKDAKLEGADLTGTRLAGARVPVR